jgi:hypothetical protein
MVKSDGGYLVLADPPNRTAANRKRFVELLTSGCTGGGGARAARLSLEECCLLDSCRTQLLDPEMVGGKSCTKLPSPAPSSGSNHADTVPVQLMVFRSSLGTDTVGVKMPT